MREIDIIDNPIMDKRDQVEYIIEQLVSKHLRLEKFNGYDMGEIQD